MNRIAFLILLFFPFIHSLAQPSALRENELKLQALFIDQHKTTSPTNDSIPLLMETTLNLQGAFDYPFDSLKYIGKIYSDDQKIRVLTWNFILADGSTQYFGYIMQKNGNSTILHVMNDSESLTGDAINSEYEAKSWYGALIYDIIDTRISGETVYTLLAYDPGDLFMKRKIIDVLHFQNGKPEFGLPLFAYNNRIQKRVIFEYSSKAQHSLVYNKEKNMVVFNHLIPVNPSFKGNHRYYVPDLTFDGFKLDKGMWVYQENVDVRN